MDRAVVEELMKTAIAVAAYDTLLRQYAGPKQILFDGDCKRIDAAYDAMVAQAKTAIRAAESELNKPVDMGS